MSPPRVSLPLVSPYLSNRNESLSLSQMSHINRFPSVLQGVEKGRRGQESGKTIGLRNSNIPVLAASKGLIQPKVPIIVIVP